MNSIYSNIREIRLSKRLSQQSLSRRLNIVVSAYSKIERGQTQLTIERLEKIADILNVSVEFIRSYHLHKKKLNISGLELLTQQKITELHTDTISLLKCQVENLIKTKFDSIMVTFEGLKIPFEEIKNDCWALNGYEENGRCSQ